MAIKTELKTLDGLDEATAALYVEKDGGGYRLDIEGDIGGDNSGLKSALQKEREARKEREKDLARIKAEREEAEKRTLEEKQQYKELWEREKGEKEALKKQRLSDKKDFFVTQLTNSLTKDQKKATVLKSTISNYVGIGDAGDLVPAGSVEITSLDGLQDFIKEQFPFLIDGSQATGGGATGSRGARGAQNEITKSQFDALSPEEKMNFHLKGGRVMKE